MAVVFDDSIGLYILLIEFFLEVDIFVAILLIFIDYLFGVVKIIFKIFIFVFKLLDSIEKFFVVQLICRQLLFE